MAKPTQKQQIRGLAEMHSLNSIKDRLMRLESDVSSVSLAKAKSLNRIIASLEKWQNRNT